MIPTEIHRLFDLIEYLDEHKAGYIEYIPLCNELVKLDIQRNELNPDRNYREKYRYDEIQNEISGGIDKISQYIQNPIKSKLLELKIWSGDAEYSSIWNNSYTAISKFKTTFVSEDVVQVMKYKKKYLDFRAETNHDFVIMFIIFKELDKILKELFNFFKDTDSNEFETFEIKNIKFRTLKEAVEYSLENGKSVSFTLPDVPIFLREDHLKLPGQVNIYNNIMGNKTEIGNISNNSGQVSVGEDIKIEVNAKDELARSSFNWQKWLGIIGAILAILGIIVTVVVA